MLSPRAARLRSVVCALCALAALCGSSRPLARGLAAHALEGRVPRGCTPLHDSVAYRRAVALDLAGRYREALGYYEEASREPGGARARYHSALTQGVLTRLAHLRRFPEDGRAHFSLGVDAANKLTALLRETGVVARAFYTLAEAGLRQALRLLPATSDPAICLAGLYADAGEPARAREALGAIAGKRLGAGETYNLACYHHSMGEYEQALAELSKVMSPYYRGWILESDDFYRLRGEPRLEALLVGPVQRGRR